MNDKKYWHNAQTNDIYSQTNGALQPENTVEINYEQYLNIINPSLPQEKIIEKNEIKAKNLVKRTLNSNIILNNREFSVNSDFHNFLKDYVDSRNSDNGDLIVDWFDTNYLHVQVTLQDLRTILRTYQERILSTLKSYNEWLATDRLTSFSIG